MNLLDNLAVPIPYLLQEKTNFEFLDDCGWSLMHYATAFNQAAKIHELTLCEINFNVNSNSNQIPTHCLSVHGKEDLLMYEKKPFITIPYCKQGYTPVHLSVFLHQYYSTRRHEDYKKSAAVQRSIFDRMLEHSPQCIHWSDTQGLSVTDHAFLRINVNYLMKIKKIDPELSSLSQVLPLTARKICENKIAQNQPHRDNDINQEEFDFLRHLSSFLAAKHIKDRLDVVLTDESVASVRVKI